MRAPPSRTRIATSADPATADHRSESLFEAGLPSMLEFAEFPDPLVVFHLFSNRKRLVCKIDCRFQVTCLKIINTQPMQNLIL